MKFLKPEFYDDFKCIADKCTNNCCKGWNIIIDENTMNKYNNTTGSLGEKLKNNIKEKELYGKKTMMVELDENKMCPFLNEGGLCEIVLEKGPNYLSNTCTTYPRHTFRYSDIIEKSLNTSCPAVVEFLYKKKYLEFILSEVDLHIKPKTPKEDEQIFFDADIRRFFIDLLQLEGVPLWVRQYFVAKCAHNIQPYYDKKNFDAVSNETDSFTDLDYLADYADQLMAIKENYYLKFNFLKMLYLSFGGAAQTNLMKYQDKISQLGEIPIEKLTEIYKSFNEEVYNNIEYVFENLCVLNLFNEFFGTTDLNIYEKCSSVFLLSSLIKFSMALYWHANNSSISKEEQIDIISIFSRNLMNNKNNIIEFCRRQEKEGQFKPSYLFLIMR